MGAGDWMGCCGDRGGAVLFPAERHVQVARFLPVPGRRLLCHDLAGQHRRERIETERPDGP